MAYYLYRFKNLMPDDYIKKSAGARAVIRAFYEKDMELKDAR